MRVGDEVEITRGMFKGETGRIVACVFSGASAQFRVRHTLPALLTLRGWEQREELTESWFSSRSVRPPTRIDA